MAIKPFIDRGHRVGGIGARRQHKPAVEDPKTSASSNPYPQAQGVSIRTFRDNRCRLLPIISANGFETNVVDDGKEFKSGVGKIDHQVAQNAFGYVQEFIFYERATGASSTQYLPFEDIFALRKGSDAIAFLKDPGITAYPQIMLNPNYKNPGMMNGVIEPLEVRGTLPGASVDSPFVAHSVKASTQNNVIQYTRGYTQNRDKTTAYIDSQDTRMSVEGFIMGVPGISDFGNESISSFDDSQSKMSIDNDLASQNESLFNDFPGVGIISKMSVNTAFEFEPNRSVTRGETGIRNASSVDSLAFGGLIK